VASNDRKDGQCCLFITEEFRLNGMLEFKAPDGSNPGFMYSTTALWFPLPPGRTAALYATSDADWEQAALVYLQGYRLHDDLGNYERRVTLLVYAQEYPQQLVFTGWHKEGRPNSELPWLPSQGTSGPSFVAWKDTSAADAPYNDLRIDIVIGPPIGQQQQRLTTPQYAYQVSTAQRAYQISHLLTYLSTLAEVGRQTTLSGALDSAPNLDEAIGRVIDEYLAEGDPRETGSESAADLLIADLLWRGHSIEAGSLRNRLTDLAQDVLRRARARTRTDARTSR
jgi:hypothetical protein